MKIANVSISIGDPWELGEAIGWPKMIGILYMGINDGDKIVLSENIDFNGHVYREFSVSVRHEGHELNEVIMGKVACNFSSKDVDPGLNFTGSISQA